MSRKARSMRGEVVDFDLFALKEQINGAPITETIRNRETFIDLKRRRGTKRKLQDMLATQEADSNKAKASERKAEQVEAADEAADVAPKRKITKKES